MDLKSLKLFLHLAQTLHYGKSSEALHVSPSTLSRSISRLEEEVGKALFERDNRSVSLTQAGIELRGFAEETLSNWQRLQSRLQIPSSELQGQIRIYCSVTASYSFMLDILTRFRAEYQNIEVILETGDAAMAIQRVSEQEIDLAVTPRPDQVPGQLDFLSLIETPLVFIGPNVECPVKAQLEYRPWDWSQIPVVNAEYGLARKRLDHWFRKQNIKPKAYTQVAGHEAIVSMVGLGFGVGVVPGLVLDNSPMKDRIQMLEVEPALAPFDVSLCTLSRRREDPLLKSFWNVASKWAG